MKEEQVAQILRMVADNKVSVEEGVELLDALDTLRDEGISQAGTPVIAGTNRKIEVGVSDNGRVIVNSIVPLSLVHADRQFLPRQVRHYLTEFEIDLDELIEQADDLCLSGTLATVTKDQVNIWISLQ